MADVAAAKRRGIRLWCPQCQEITACHADKPEHFGLPTARRFQGARYKDVQWFRRVRLCDVNQHDFITGELSEELITELMDLRDRVAAMQRPKVDRTLRQHKWLSRKETIPHELAATFVRKTAWWLTHSSGSPVRAPGHASRIYLSEQHGWSVEFGANTFLVGKALERCRDRIRTFFDRIKSGEVPTRSEVERSLRAAIAGSVANHVGEEYVSYPDDHKQLVFGAQAINLADGARFVVENSGIGEYLAPG